MGFSFKRFLLASFAVAAISQAHAEDARMVNHVYGKPKAPVTVDEFVSLTCSHCAEFYTAVLPQLEKDYIDSGKVKFIIHDYPLDGLSLKAASIAHCMPEDEYIPFIKALYATQAHWAFGTEGTPEDRLVQMAKLAGLPEDKARACANDTKLQDAIVAGRTEASTKYKVEATPTFIVNDGADTIQGAQPADVFKKAFDKALAKK